MFDFHMHTTVSFDGKCSPREMVDAALRSGLREICFTDHIDYDVNRPPEAMTFRTEDYNAAYEGLTAPGLAIRLGVEFGMKPDNREQFARELQRRPFDFVLGSVHYVGEQNVYREPYWTGRTGLEAENRYLEETLTCVRTHDQFDVLAHLNFLSKSPFNREHCSMAYRDHRELADEILRELARKDKGLEMNTSGIDRGVGFLPHRDFFQRFYELGGRIVTVGSDAHTADRVGQYTGEACEILREIFGYVCTFENRQPIFHKL